MTGTQNLVRTLEFNGEVRSNKRRFAKDMVIPGKHALSAALNDWPACLEPGTLNVGIRADGFPSDFAEFGTGKGVKKLDEGRFRPAFVIPHTEIVNNTLRPAPRSPLKGTGQVWRARLQVVSTSQQVECWVFRRIESGIAGQLELVSDMNLRSQLGLTEGTSVIVTLIEGSGHTIDSTGRSNSNTSTQYEP